ncbi:VOC family protein [Acaryochloris sp. IP29b_bin.148]|uniref:VOC family protein n=1 Tax=Acaryochloris sp. IP29b_bin.148 TaxID=2969218 RepID=UPI00260164F4|nr:VOC family protein [Acaryochloris sp. IP29b_bin.148]
MKIYITSVFVDNQELAHDFYTKALGFETKHDIPMGEHRWLTLIESENPNGVELLLEPSSHPAVPPYKAALVADGIPAISLRVADVHHEFGRLQSQGVEFTQPPTNIGNLVSAVFNDTCGNLVQIIQFDD